jgi:hypothetical protein
MINYPHVGPALKVDQPLGTFYVAVLPARLLLETCYSDRLRAVSLEADGVSYKLDGTQRGLDLGATGKYLKRNTFREQTLLSQTQLFWRRTLAMKTEL